MIERDSEHPRERSTRIGRARGAIAIIVVAVAAVVIWGVKAQRDDRPVPAAPSGPVGDASVLEASVAVPASGESPGELLEGPPEGSLAAAETARLPRMLDLGADKCVPCKVMAPILDELRETYTGQLEVEFVDVWKDPAPGKQYRIQVIPTQIFFDEHGKELFRHQGFMSREDILAKWREFGYEFEE